MSDATKLSALNDLLINVGRSLLQYVGECWPWAETNTGEEQQTIERLVEQQREQVARLAELLRDAQWPLDFGTYPTAYTDLHYVALDYLMDQLIQNQSALIDDAKAALPLCQDDQRARQLVEEIRSVQQSIVGELKTLAGGIQPSQTKSV